MARALKTTRRRSLARVLALGAATALAPCAIASGPAVYLAVRRPEGGVDLVLRSAQTSVRVGTDLPGPSGSEWRPFGVRTAGRASLEDTGGVFEIEGDLPRLQVRSDFQLVLFESIGTDASGIAAVGARGVKVLRSAADERYRVRDGGAYLEPGGRRLGLVVRGEEREEVLLLDLSGAEPAAVEVIVPLEAERLEPWSLSVTRDAVFFSGRLEDGSWAVYRAPAAAAPPAGPPASVAAERIAGPFESLGSHMASSEEAVAFLGGPREDELDLFVARGLGPAVNVTSSDGSAGAGPILLHDPESPRLAVSSDGLTVAYSLEVRGEPETFVHDVRAPGPGGGAQITSDDRFNPYIDQESWIFFAAEGSLLFAAGHDPVTTDVFRVNGALASPAINLTRTGSGLEPPFLVKGTLAVSALAASGGVAVVAASDILGARPSVVAGVDVATGATLFVERGLDRASGFFALGADLYYTAALQGGESALLRVRAGAQGQVGRAPAGGASPRLLLQEGDRALASLPGTGLIELRAASDPRLLAPAAGPVVSAVLGSGGRQVVFARPASGGNAYALLDVAAGVETPLFGAPVEGEALAVAEGAPLFLRGDSNGDGSLDIADPVATLLYLFAGTAAVPCLDAADADDDGALVLTDPIRLLLHLFAGGPPLPPPYPEPGLDATPDGLGCGGELP